MNYFKNKKNIFLVSLIFIIGFLLYFFIKKTTNENINIILNENNPADILIINNLSKNECTKNEMIKIIDNGDIVKNIDIKKIKDNCEDYAIQLNKERYESYILQRKFINDNIKK